MAPRRKEPVTKLDDVNLIPGPQTVKEEWLPLVVL